MPTEDLSNALARLERNLKDPSFNLNKLFGSLQRNRLHIAATIGFPEVLSRLLSLENIEPLLNQKDAHGLTPLAVAANDAKSFDDDQNFENSLRSAEILAKTPGVDIDPFDDENRTPLYMASQNTDSPSIVKVLIKNGADVRKMWLASYSDLLINFSGQTAKNTLDHIRNILKILWQEPNVFFKEIVGISVAAKELEALVPQEAEIRQQALLLYSSNLRRGEHAQWISEEIKTKYFEQVSLTP